MNLTFTDSRRIADRLTLEQNVVMDREEVDDTDMTPAEFRATRRRGQPVRVVPSRAEYEDARQRLSNAARPGRGYNFQVSLQPRLTSTHNELLGSQP